LPKLGEPLPPLDDGRVLVAPPAKWIRLPNSAKYLCRFQKTDQEPYPRIIVTVENFEPVFNASAQNLGDYLKHVKADLDEEARRKQAEGKGDGKPKLLEPVDTFVVDGRFYGVRYARRARTSEGDIFEQYYVETVKGGRRYVLELRDLDTTAARLKPFLYAVAVGLKFPKDAEAAAKAAKPDEETAPVAKPAETAKPEPKPAEPAKPEPKKPDEPAKPETPEKKPTEPPKKPKLGADDF
jgi:hypothetical protein